MYMVIGILPWVVLLVFGSIVDTTMVKRFVKVPDGQWQPVKSKMVKNGGAIHNMLFVSQHDAVEVKRLQEISDAVSDPDSPKYGHFLTYDEIYQSVLPKITENGHIVEQWAKENGLTVTKTTRNKQFIMVEATADTVERVFQTKLQQYKHIKTGELVSRGTSFVLPSNIHDRVALIEGLSSFPVSRNKNRVVSNAPQAPAHAPLLFTITSGFGHYQFYITPVCDNGHGMTGSFCDGQFNGFQIAISDKSEAFDVSVAEANCVVCSPASPVINFYCDPFKIPEGFVLCRFYLKNDDSIPLYEPHTFAVRTRFLSTFSENATYNSPFEKGIDITPPVLRSLYSVDDKPTAQRNSKSRQAILGIGQYLDMKSFRSFKKRFGKNYKLVFGKIYGTDYRNNTEDEGETSLDIEYMASMGFGIPMDYISVKKNDVSFERFFFQVAMLEEHKKNVVPLVYSISYSEDETRFQTSDIATYELQFMIMSVTGKTVFASSGDYGSTAGDGQCRKVSFPQYPASSAYVTAVGATQFVKAKDDCSRKLDGYCLKEITSQVNTPTGCFITSGGGFSNSIQSPHYQHKAVQNYLENPAIPLPPDSFYHRNNRAYPDVSLAGHQYLTTQFGDGIIFLDGTSASSPALAGLFSLIVNRRLNLRLKPLGLLNPLLYKLSTTHPEVFYDITIGNNSCIPSSPRCCEYSFVAGKGWDPLTGLGSINHRELMKQLTKQ